MAFKENIYMPFTILIWKILLRTRVILKIMRKTIAGQKYYVPMPLIKYKQQSRGFRVFMRLSKKKIKQRTSLFFHFLTFFFKFSFEFKILYIANRINLHLLATENFMNTSYRWEY